jgi:hypothetical protein
LASQDLHSANTTIGDAFTSIGAASRQESPDSLWTLVVGCVSCGSAQPYRYPSMCATSTDGRITTPQLHAAYPFGHTERCGAIRALFRIEQVTHGERIHSPSDFYDPDLALGGIVEAQSMEELHKVQGPTKAKRVGSQQGLPRLPEMHGHRASTSVWPSADLRGAGVSTHPLMLRHPR